jgi:hypothetical protein
VGISRRLELSPLLFQGTGAVLPDQFTPGVIQQGNDEADELVNGGKSFGSLRVRMIGTKGPVLGDRINCLLDVD